MTLLFLNNLQDLKEIQKISYLKFIFQNLKDGFKKILGQEDHLIPEENLLISMGIQELVNLKFIYPKLNYANCKRQRITYDFTVKVPIILILTIILEDFIIIKYRYFYGRIPLLTSDGTYLINGCERIVVNQLIKKPGVTFKKIRGPGKKFIYFANIISSNNCQTRIYLDEIQEIEKKKRKLIKINWDDIFYIEKNNNIIKFETYEYKDIYNAQEKFNFKQFIIITKTVKSFRKNIKQKNIKQKNINKNIFRSFKFFKKYNFKKKNLSSDYEKLNSNYQKNCLVDIILKKNNPFLSQYELKKWRKKNKNFTKIHAVRPPLPYTNYKKGLFEDIDTSLVIDKSQLLKFYNISTDNIKFKLLSNFRFTKYSYSTKDLSIKYNYDTYIRTLNIKKKIIKNYFDNKKLYLGFLGRDSFNKRFGFNKLHYNFVYDFSKKKYMTINDFIDIFNKLYDIKYNYDNVDNIDNLDFKQIKSSGEFLKKYFNEDLKKKFEEKNEGFLISSFVGLISPIYNFFVTTQISQYADQINPLSTLAHKRKLSLFGPGGLERERINLNLRDINPTQFSKICFIETSEGRNAGVVTTLALTSRISKNLSLEAPYIFVNNKIYSTSNLVFLDAAYEKKSLISFENCLENFKKISFLKKEILIRKNLDFLVKNFKELNYLTLSPIQTLSLGISIIPFVEHNDGNRALMGSNMQRQAVPLLNSNRAIVGIGREYNIASDSKFVIRSYSEGIIKYIDNKIIFLKDTKNQFIYYNLPKSFITNQYLISFFKSSVWINEKVYSGEIIAASSNIIENELALGSNLTLAYMTWEGYNFEDAIIINENLVTNNTLTSIHTNIYEIIIPLKSFMLNLNYEPIFSSVGILKIGSYVYPGSSILEIKTNLLHKEEDEEYFNNFLDNFGSSILKIKTNLLYKEDEEYFSNFLDSSNKRINYTLSPEFKFEGRLVKTEVHVKGDQIIFKLRIAKHTQIEVGDKLSGRHGNKGIISRILPSNEMPYLPNGDTIDLIVNPLGVPSRMNVGQLFECLLGISGEKLGFRYKVFPFDETISKNSSRILVHTFMYKSMYKLKRSWFYNDDLSGKILLRDGRTGEYYDNKIIVGKAYILKLIHLVEDKIHSRALGPYSSITEQPLQGSANAGGQRFGEMEVWALEAHGSSVTLQELLTIKSDNLDAREEIYLALKKKNLKNLPIPVLPEIFILLINEFKALILDTSFNNSQKSLYFSTNNKLNLFKYLENRLKIKTKLEA